MTETNPLKAKIAMHDMILHHRTEDTLQQPSFQERHFAIVSTITRDAAFEVMGKFDDAHQHNLEQVLAKGVDQASNVFRPFDPDSENPRHVYKSHGGFDRRAGAFFESDPNDTKLSQEYHDAFQQTGPIAIKYLKELFVSAGITDVDPSTLMNSLTMSDLVNYVKEKTVWLFEGDQEKSLQAADLQDEDLKSAMNELVPEADRLSDPEYIGATVASIKYDGTHGFSENQKLAIDLMFVFINALWKVQQVHRVAFETKLKADKLDPDITSDFSSVRRSEARIAESRLDYHTYTGFMAGTVGRRVDQSARLALADAAFGVHKDLHQLMLADAKAKKSGTQDDGSMNSTVLDVNGKRVQNPATILVDESKDAQRFKNAVSEEPLSAGE